MYNVVRNPMYVGNALIAIGMAKYMGAPRAILIVVPFFLFVYQSIVFAEEEYLRNKFGAEYDEYCARVNRFIPSLGNIRESFAGMQLDWKMSIKKRSGNDGGTRHRLASHSGLEDLLPCRMGCRRVGRDDVLRHRLHLRV